MPGRRCAPGLTGRQWHSAQAALAVEKKGHLSWLWRRGMGSGVLQKPPPRRGMVLASVAWWPSYSKLDVSGSVWHPGPDTRAPWRLLS